MFSPQDCVTTMKSATTHKRNKNSTSCQLFFFWPTQEIYFFFSKIILGARTSLHSFKSTSMQNEAKTKSPYWQHDALTLAVAILATVGLMCWVARGDASELLDQVVAGYKSNNNNNNNNNVNCDGIGLAFNERLAECESRPLNCDAEHEQLATLFARHSELSRQLMRGKEWFLTVAVFTVLGVIMLALCLVQSANEIRSRYATQTVEVFRDSYGLELSDGQVKTNYSRISGLNNQTKAAMRAARANRPLRLAFLQPTDYHTHEPAQLDVTSEGVATLYCDPKLVVFEHLDVIHRAAAAIHEHYVALRASTTPTMPTTPLPWTISVMFSVKFASDVARFDVAGMRRVLHALELFETEKPHASGPDVIPRRIVIGCIAGVRYEPLNVTLETSATFDEIRGAHNFTPRTSNSLPEAKSKN
jgi:hypothetical protein